MTATLPQPVCEHCNRPPPPSARDEPEIDEDAVRRGQVVEGREYLGHGCWCHLNRVEPTLRDN